MAYSPPTISSTGLTIPSYEDILTYLLQQFVGIYGQGVYLENDSWDYQDISTRALIVADAMQALQLVYNNFGAMTAVGAAQDSLYKLNGLARNEATYSTVQETLTGEASTIISNGSVRDVNGFIWVLPALVVIGSGGSITVTATCQTLGVVSAGAGTVNIINSPTAGWVSTSNSAPAVPGRPVESDSAFRARQSISTALPSITMPAGTIAGLYATPGVTRINFLENPTNVNDIWGNPSHSITCVVEGGTDAAVAATIYNNRGLGCYMNGTNAVSYTDPNTGIATVVRFDRPAYVQLTVTADIHLINGTTATLTAISAAIVTYLNSLSIGELVTVSGVMDSILALVGNPLQPLFSVRLLTIGYTSILTALAVNNGGSGYAVGDQVQILQSGSSLGGVAMVSVVSGGVVTGLTLIQSGVDYTTASAVGTGTLTGAGSGLTVNTTAANSQGTLDLGLHFYEVTQGVTGNVTVTSV